MGKADRISGTFLLLFAIFMAILSYRLGLGTLHKPGPGFLFFWTSVTLGALSMVVFIRAGGKGDRGTQGPVFEKENLGKASLVLAICFLYAIFMEIVGFIPVTLMLFLFLLGVIEKKRWTLTVFVSVVVTVISYLIFEVWLQSQLPKGILESFRF